MARSGVKITTKDRGYRKFVRELKKSGRLVVDVGVVGPRAAALKVGSDGSPTTVAEVASYHEFGRGVPERSFIRSTVDKETSKIRQMQRRLARGVLQRKVTELRALEILGMQIASDIKATIEANVPPPLAESTKRRRKGGADVSHVALIDTGQMKNAVTFDVRAE